MKMQAQQQSILSDHVSVPVSFSRRASRLPCLHFPPPGYQVIVRAGDQEP